MRKIFSILVVLMMVAGTFVSCNMPVNDTSAGSVSVVDIKVRDIENCDLSYLILANGKKAICTDAVRILIDAASDKQSALNAQRKIYIMNKPNAPDGWDNYIYDIALPNGWVTAGNGTRWGEGWLSINTADTNTENTIDAGLGFRIYLPTSHITR